MPTVAAQILHRTLEHLVIPNLKALVARLLMSLSQGSQSFQEPIKILEHRAAVVSTTKLWRLRRMDGKKRNHADGFLTAWAALPHILCFTCWDQQFAELPGESALYTTFRTTSCPHIQAGLPYLLRHW